MLERTLFADGGGGGAGVKKSSPGRFRTLDVKMVWYMILCLVHDNKRENQVFADETL